MTTNNRPRKNIMKTTNILSDKEETNIENETNKTYSVQHVIDFVDIIAPIFLIT
jgi:hypothetical protein